MIRKIMFQTLFTSFRYIPKTSRNPKLSMIRIMFKISINALKKLNSYFHKIK